jgi:hypothetical protein
VAKRYDPPLIEPREFRSPEEIDSAKGRGCANRSVMLFYIDKSYVKSKDLRKMGAPTDKDQYKEYSVK